MNKQDKKSKKGKATIIEPIESNYDESTVYERIEKARNHAGLENNSALSVATGIKEGTISKWKKSGNVPQMPQLMKICNACDVDIDYLLGRISTFKRINNPIHDATGLTEDAIEVLRKHRKDEKSTVTIFGLEFNVIKNDIADLISCLITYDHFYDLMQYIRHYTEMQIDRDYVKDFHKNVIPPELKDFITVDECEDFVESKITNWLKDVVKGYIQEEITKEGKI